MNGSVSVAEWMHLKLYDPEGGYYSQNPTIGRGGDFYTAVNAGSVYGELLACAILKSWSEQGEPENFAIIEQGAHTGKLMNDVQQSLRLMSQKAKVNFQYWIVEPQEHLRNAQVQTAQGQPWNWVTRVEELPQLQGFYYANELLDALPTEQVIWKQGQWRQRRIEVIADGKYGKWLEQEIESEVLKQAVMSLPAGSEEGFVMEVSLNLIKHIKSIQSSGLKGEVLWMDYGMEHEERFEMSRHEGTLRMYHQHRLLEVDVNAQKCDITYHVDWTQVIQESESQGWKMKIFKPQGRYLSEFAVEWYQYFVESLTPLKKAEKQRQFQLLTHPVHMGKAFAAMSWKI